MSLKQEKIKNMHLKERLPVWGCRTSTEIFKKWYEKKKMHKPSVGLRIIAAYMGMFSSAAIHKLMSRPTLPSDRIDQLANLMKLDDNEKRYFVFLNTIHKLPDEKLKRYLIKVTKSKLKN